MRLAFAPFRAGRLAPRFQWNCHLPLNPCSAALGLERDQHHEGSLSSLLRQKANGPPLHQSVSRRTLCNRLLLRTRPGQNDIIRVHLLLTCGCCSQGQKCYTFSPRSAFTGSSSPFSGHCAARHRPLGPSRRRQARIFAAASSMRWRRDTLKGEIQK